MTQQPALVLASSSPYRRLLLERLKLSFRVESPRVDEAHCSGEPPTARAQRLALAKAAAVAARHPDAVVIGSDQVAACGERVLDKPGTPAVARAQLLQLSGRAAQFHTAVVVQCAARSSLESHLDTTQVLFRDLAAAEIERYVELEQPLDTAGSFKSEALGIALMERIESLDPTALVGLPLIWLAGALRRFGFRVP